MSALAFQRAMGRASDEKLWVGLEGDVVHVWKAADGYALAGQSDPAERRAGGAGHDDRGWLAGPSR